METTNKNPATIQADSALNFVNSLKYGSTFVRFADDVAHGYFVQCLEVVNAIHGKGSVGIDDAIDEITSEPVPGVYRVVFSDRRSSPSITEAESLMANQAKNAKESATAIYVKANAGLMKYARELGAEFGVKVKRSVYGICFDGSAPKSSVYARLEAAYKAGDDKIRFAPEEVKIQTVRVYASQLSAFVNDKISVGTDSEGGTVVFLKPRSKREMWEEETKAFVDRMAAEIGKWSALEVLEIEVYKRGGEVSNEPETAWTEEIGSEAWNEPELEPVADSDSESLQDGMPTRIVNGMQQFVIPVSGDLDPDDADF